MNNHSFHEKLNISKTPERKRKEIAILKKYYPDAVVIADPSQDKNDCGVDYIVVLENKETILIDFKHREKGVSRFWKTKELINGHSIKVPELTIETLSVKEKNIPGWTFDSSKLTDVIIYTFDESDYPDSIRYSFKELKDTAEEKIAEWMIQYGKKSCMTDGRYTTEFICVPINVLDDAIEQKHNREDRQNRVLIGGNSL